jgi:hypothetical protein
MKATRSRQPRLTIQTLTMKTRRTKTKTKIMQMRKEVKRKK